MRRREMMKLVGAGVGCAWAGFPSAGLAAAKPRLRAAACRFKVDVEVGAATHGKTGTKVERVAGPLMTTAILIEDGTRRICLVASDLRVEMKNVNTLLKAEASKVLGLATDRIVFFTSHNHSVPKLAEVEARHADLPPLSKGEAPEVKLYPSGERFVNALKENLARLTDALEPVTVHWTQGEEGRITYNRKGRRADGSTYFMREEDRQLVGQDFNGDIDREVPVVVFKGMTGRPVAAILQFTGHPVTSYHPEHLTIFGDYPVVAADMLGRALGGTGAPVPVAFLQGCAGDSNSKHMLSGDVDKARQYGEMLGGSAIKVLAQLRPSKRDGMDYSEQTASIPLQPLPPRSVIEAELAEMRDFVRRAEAGDENTLSCVGLNFPRALSPKYRGALVDLPKQWNEWALAQYEQGRDKDVPRTLDVPVYVLRLGDVGIVGMPFEPFLGIGRRIRANSPCALTIPCGYTNGAYGYVTDAANTGDREYMSTYYRYTRFRPPFAKPAGDVVADRAVETLRGFWN